MLKDKWIERDAFNFSWFRFKSADASSVPSIGVHQDKSRSVSSGGFYCSRIADLCLGSTSSWHVSYLVECVSVSSFVFTPLLGTLNLPPLIFSHSSPLCFCFTSHTFSHPQHDVILLLPLGETAKDNILTHKAILICRSWSWIRFSSLRPLTLFGTREPGRAKALARLSALCRQKKSSTEVQHCRY